MKKTKLLTPILSIGSVALATIPAVACAYPTTDSSKITISMWSGVKDVKVDVAEGVKGQDTQVILTSLNDKAILTNRIEILMSGIVVPTSWYKKVDITADGKQVRILLDGKDVQDDIIIYATTTGEFAIDERIKQPFEYFEEGFSTSALYGYSEIQYDFTLDLSQWREIYGADPVPGSFLLGRPGQPAMAVPFGETVKVYLDGELLDNEFYRIYNSYRIDITSNGMEALYHLISRGEPNHYLSFSISFKDNFANQYFYAFARW